MGPVDLMDDASDPNGSAFLYDRTSAEAHAATLRGSNQHDMRAHNDRLILGLLRKFGAMAKADLARVTGLSAQTVSVIMRALEKDGLLIRGEPLRGRIGQPSVPMSLAPDGAFSLGLKLGRRSAELVLVDFLGKVRGSERQTYPFPTPEGTVTFVRAALPRLLATLPTALHCRIVGMGVAMPFQLWNWTDDLGVTQAEMDVWRSCDIASYLSKAVGLPVHLQNDATSACGAELVFGAAETPRDFLYFYIGTFIGGGLVLNQQLFLGRTGNAAGVGPILLPGPEGGRRLLELASLAVLAQSLRKAGLDHEQIWERSEGWQIPEAVLSPWVETAAEGLALATLSAAALLEVDAVMIDGWLPVALRQRITLATQAALERLDTSGITPFEVREGTLGAQARSLGAAAIPFSQRYMIDQNAAMTPV